MTIGVSHIILNDEEVKLLEPAVVETGGAVHLIHAEVSKAISLKRIADSLSNPYNSLNIRDILSEMLDAARRSN